MSGKSILFIPFEGGVAAGRSLSKIVAQFKEGVLRDGDKVVEWPHDQSKSPLGKEVDANNDVIIIAGNMSSDSEASPGICMRTELQKPGQVLTKDDDAYISDGGLQGARQIILNVQEVAARLRSMGLRPDHKFISLGVKFPDDYVKVTLFTRQLALELATIGSYKDRSFPACSHIRIGYSIYYPGLKFFPSQLIWFDHQGAAVREELNFVPNRQDLNITNSTFTQQMQSYSDCTHPRDSYLSYTNPTQSSSKIVGDAAKELQSNISNTQDAVNQQSNLATSILQQFQTIVTAIYQ